MNKLLPTRGRVLQLEKIIDMLKAQVENLGKELVW